MGLSTHPGGIFYIVAVNVLQKGPSVFAFYKKLPHMGNIKHSDIVSDSIVLIDDVRVLNRHYESSERTHLCSESDVAVIETGFLFRIVVFHYLTKVLQVIGLLCYSLYYFNKSILGGKQSA